MRAVIQRVLSSSVQIDGETKAQIEKGMMVLVGIEEADNKEDIEWLARKMVNLRIFEDAHDVMNESLLDKGYELLLISQFTLHASTKKGNRPSYIKAAKPDVAVPLYEDFKKELTNLLGKPVKSGEFGADMKVALVNDGPVTIVMDTKQKE